MTWNRNTRRGAGLRNSREHEWPATGVTLGTVNAVLTFLPDEGDRKASHPYFFWLFERHRVRLCWRVKPMWIFNTYRREF